ncbi:MAG TPA: hypothetical protein VMF08_14810 [Candidatus Sulfotelmatobacter sp.]|nr:hypothetical protein [Candidatus Sulfotelmatobacter sp.]
MNIGTAVGIAIAVAVSVAIGIGFSFVPGSAYDWRYFTRYAKALPRLYSYF